MGLSVRMVVKGEEQNKEGKTSDQKQGNASTSSTGAGADGVFHPSAFSLKADASGLRLGRDAERGIIFAKRSIVTRSLRWRFSFFPPHFSSRGSPVNTHCTVNAKMQAIKKEPEFTEEISHSR